MADLLKFASCQGETFLYLVLSFFFRPGEEKGVRQRPKEREAVMHFSVPQSLLLLLLLLLDPSGKV